MCFFYTYKLELVALRSTRSKIGLLEHFFISLTYFHYCLRSSYLLSSANHKKAYFPLFVYFVIAGSLSTAYCNILLRKFSANVPTGRNFETRQAPDVIATSDILRRYNQACTYWNGWVSLRTREPKTLHSWCCWRMGLYR